MGYTPPQVEPGLDTIWVAINTFIIFFMQLGFTMVEAGTVRVKNLHSILMMNCLDVCINTLVWWIIGYSFAFGESQGGFVGFTVDLLIGKEFDQYNSYLHFMNQWAFSATSTTILSGAVAERLTIKGYLILCVFYSLLIYPLPVHWIWGQGGWLIDNGFHDFAGVTAVHIVGGATGLVATFMTKSRKGRFDPNESNKFKPNSVPFVVLGTLLLWFCWYGFNCGTVQGLNQNYQLVGLVGLNTTVGAAAGGLSCFVVTYIIEPRTQYDLATLNICMGILAGLVSITGGCDVFDPWVSIIIGLVGGAWFHLFQKFLFKYKIDDPLDASTIHMGCGIWGTISVGLFQKDTGLIYGGSSIGIQLLGLLVVLLFVFGITYIVMKIIQNRGLLRLSPKLEEIGFDKMYNEFQGDTEYLNLILEGISELKTALNRKNNKKYD